MPWICVALESFRRGQRYRKFNDGSPQGPQRRPKRYFESGTVKFSHINSRYYFLYFYKKFKEKIKDCKLVNPSDDYIVKWLIGDLH